MSQRHWTAVALVWATGLGVFVYGLLFLGSQVAPCLGLSNTPPQDACVAAWEARRTWIDRLWGAPETYPILLLVLASVVMLATLLVVRHGRRQPQAKPPRDVRRP